MSDRMLSRRHMHGLDSISTQNQSMDRPMDQKTVRNLEKEIEKAVAEVILRLGLGKLPLMPSQATMHMMAKAAVAVYEAAVENQDEVG